MSCSLTKYLWPGRGLATLNHLGRWLPGRPDTLIVVWVGLYLSEDSEALVDSRVPLVLHRVIEVQIVLTIDLTPSAIDRVSTTLPGLVLVEHELVGEAVLTFYVLPVVVEELERFLFVCRLKLRIRLHEGVLLLELALDEHILSVRLNEESALLSQELEGVLDGHHVLGMFAKHVELTDTGQESSRATLTCSAVNQGFLTRSICANYLC